MAFKIRRLDYYYTLVTDQPGAGYELLSSLASLGVNLLAFTAIPIGPEDTQLTLFPEDPLLLTTAAKQAGMKLTGPHPALLVQGDDELGALAKVHSKLADARVNVYASICVTDGVGRYSYVIYVRPDEYERALTALAV